MPEMRRFSRAGSACGVEGEEPEIPLLALAHKRRSQLDRVVASQRVALGEVAREPDQILRYGWPLVGRPPVVEGGNHVGMFHLGQSLFPQQPGERSPGFGVGDHRSRDLRALLDGADYQIAVRLVYEDFDQGRGVQVEYQRRSTMTISAAVFSPRTVGASS